MSGELIASAAAPVETDEQAIERLARLSKLEYDRARDDEAQKLGVRVGTLDKEVAKLRKHTEDTNTADELIEGVEPWPESVAGDEVLEQIRGLFQRHCVLPEGGDIAISLWALAGYTINAFRIYPKLLLSSPEKRCGKTTTLEVIGAVAHRALTASNASPSVLFRAIELWQPSLLIDEADTFIHQNDELRGVINSGHTRSGAFVLRTEGDSSNREPMKFSTWAPMCLAMIKTPPDTISDRSVTITLRRKLPNESVTKLPFSLAEACHELRRKCKRWADDHTQQLRGSQPHVPSIRNERAMDNWLPLLAVADAAGGDWPELARRAMTVLEHDDAGDDSIGPKLLSDIRDIFTRFRAGSMFSGELVDRLIELEGRPWSEWRRGKPITQNSLSRLLGPFGIKTRDMRRGNEVKRGYKLTDFEDAFARYLQNPSVQSATVLQPSNHADSSDFQSTTESQRVAFQKSRQPSNHAACSTVALENAAKRAVGNDKELF